MSNKQGLSARDGSLAHFIEVHHDELVARCRAKVATRTVPKPTDVELEHGIPLFLKQLARILRDRAAPRGEMSRTAGLHGDEMHVGGFTVTQVVHDYGDACQSITQLAIELNAVISTEDFRGLNAALDDAIADAVTAYTRRRETAASAADLRFANERLGYLAHEIRNSVYAAILAFEALNRGSVGVRGSTGALLARSLIGMRDLIDRTLADVRLTAGIQTGERIAVRDLIEEIEIAALMEAKSRDLALTVSPVAADVLVHADRQILGSVVSNLVQNALKFTRPGGEVAVRATATKDRVLIDVEDECGGLPAGAAERIFRPFEQGGHDRSGVGLGLAICRRGVDAIGGDIAVRDLPGKGCVFTIDLPRDVAD